MASTIGKGKDAVLAPRAAVLDDTTPYSSTKMRHDRPTLAPRDRENKKMSSSADRRMLFPQRVSHFDQINARELPATRPVRICGSGPTHSVMKRAVDIIVAGFALIILSPILLSIAVLVRLDSRGPILFRQRRLRVGGREFMVWKFRTMRPDAEQVLAELESRNESPGGVLFKIRDDPRVTRLGRFLRRTSLDELPQFFNVFHGDMSLVGPRPLQLRDCNLLRQLDPEGFARRLAVPQGLTGPWQISGRSNENSETMLRLDLDYIENWTFASDLMIILKTVPAVLFCRGAC
jgi:lipopolysaccharide/colanic/teichoic acid biosynthesis glycosyltransferase